MGNTRRFAVLAILAVAFVTFVWLVRQGPQQQPPNDRDETPAAFQTVPRPEIAKPDGRTISGRVVNGRDEALAGASVTVHHAERGTERTSSDATGAFEVRGLSPGNYRVSASASHYNETVLEAVAAGSDAVQLVLRERSSVWGTVRRAGTGDPVEAFEVAYLERPPNDGEQWAQAARGSRTRWVAFTGNRGVYNITDVASGAPFAVAARAFGFEPTYVAVPAIGPGEAAGPVDIQLAAEAVVRGRVLSPAHEPVVGASVHLGTHARGRAVAASDRDGQFTLKGLGNEEILLSAAHPDYLPATATITPVRGQTTSRDIVLGQGASVEGTIWRGGDPIPNQPVIVSRLRGLRFRKETTADAQGRYTVSGIPPGEIEVLVALAGREDRAASRLQQKVMVAAGETITVDFRFPALFGALEGTITIDGAPPAAGRVHATLVGVQTDAAFAVTVQENGYYRIENLPPGRFSLDVTATSRAGLEYAVKSTLDLGEGELVRRDLALEAQEKPD